MIFQCCVVFYSVVYLTGSAIYRWMGSANDVQNVQSISSWHMPLLEFLMALLLLSAPVVRPGANANGMNPAVHWVPIGIGMALLGHAVFQMIRFWRRREVRA